MRLLTLLERILMGKEDEEFSKRLAENPAKELAVQQVASLIVKHGDSTKAAIAIVEQFNLSPLRP